MKWKRITISVPTEIAEKAARATAAGEAESVSDYFAQLAAREPDWATARAVLDEMLADSEGISEDDRLWAATVLDLREQGTDAA